MMKQFVRQKLHQEKVDDFCKREAEDAEARKKQIVMQAQMSEDKRQAFLDEFEKKTKQAMENSNRLMHKKTMASKFSSSLIQTKKVSEAQRKVKILSDLQK